MTIFVTSHLFLKPQKWGSIPGVFQKILQKTQFEPANTRIYIQAVPVTSKVSILIWQSAAGISLPFFRKCLIKVQYSEANTLIITPLLLDEKYSDIL